MDGETDLTNNENVNPESDMSDNEIGALVDETIPESTKRSTVWGTNVFKKWQTKRQLNIDFSTISAEELAGHLKKFYAELKKSNGDLYTPSALVGIRAAIHRALVNPPYMRNINILDGVEFIAANRVFLAKTKIYTARGNPKPKHKPCISNTDMGKLGAYFHNHTEDPVKLLEFVWFSLCYYFGRRGREGWRLCTPETFRVETDEDGIEYLTEGITMTSKNHQGGAKVDDNDYSDPRLYNDEVIKSFRMLLSKRNVNNNALFQTPMRDVGVHSDVWYKNEPMGHNVISKIMPKLSKKAGLSTSYTAHSIRASMITILFRAGVQPKEICGITKHKREASLDPYIRGSSSAQKRQCSNVLSGALGLEV